MQPSLLPLDTGWGLVWVAMIAGLLNIAPSLITYHIAGDLISNYALVQCFGEQIWTGHVYPRWCMNANVGYGSPAPIFYFPLPYYISSLFYPLRYVGLDIPDIYLVALWSAAVVTFITVTLWLSAMTTRRMAMACAFIFLWTSYRMEVAVFRSSYAELWCLAFLPLVFLQVRRMVTGEGVRWPVLALLIAVCMLCHAPATLIGLMACGLYLLVFLRQKPRAMFSLAAATLLAFGATQFHWQAASILEITLHPNYGGVGFWKISWVNSNVVEALKLRREVWGPLLSHAIMGITALLMVVWMLRKRPADLSHFVRQDLLAWTIIILFSAVMVSPLADPLWDGIERLSKVRTPWRAASLIGFGFIVVIAHASHTIFKIDNWKHRVGAGLLAVVVIAIGVNMRQEVRIQDENARQMIIFTQEIFGYFNTRWSNVHQYGIEDKKPFYEKFVFNKPEAKASFVAGEGSAEVLAWGYDGLHFSITSKAGGTVRIEHLYNPQWFATLDGVPFELRAESNDIGRMLADIPAGTHTLRINWKSLSSILTIYRNWCIFSAVCWIIMMAGYIRTRNSKH